MRRYVFLAVLCFGGTAFAQIPTVSNADRDSNMVKQFFFAGLREKLSENYNTASTNFNKVIHIDPNNHAAYFELATANFKMDKLTEAEQNIKKAIQLNANNQWYYRLLVEVYKRNHNMAALVSTFDELIRIDPENDAYYYDKANAYVLSNKLDEAKAVYAQIESKFGPSPALQVAKERLNTGKDATESNIIKLLEGNQADVKNYLYAAGLLMQKGNDPEALKVLLKAQQLEPGNFEVNLAIADIYRKQKRDGDAFSALKLAFESAEMPNAEKIKIIAGLFPKMDQPIVAEHVSTLSKVLAEKNPTDAKVLALYGDVLYQQHKLKEALSQYQAALKLNEQVYIVWEQVVNIHTLLGHYEEAVKIGDEALSIYPNQASLYYYLAYALFKTGKLQPALSNLKSALQLDVENKSLQAQVYALQGDILINQNNFAQAKVAFEKAIELEPDNYLIMNNYAYYLALRNEDLTKAAKYAETAANALSDDASVSDTYAFILFKQQKYDLAKTWIEKALQNNSPKNGVYLEHYGDILFMKGEKEAAVEQWKKAKIAGNDSELLNKKINEKKYFK